MLYGRSIAIGVLCLCIVFILSGIIFYLSLGPCPSGTFACDNGEMCVPQRQICDYRIDCRDGSDEHPVECGLLYGSIQMTNKIVGDAIEKQRQYQNFSDKHLWMNLSYNQTNDKTSDKTNHHYPHHKFYHRINNNNNSNSNNLQQIKQCAISKYPKECICHQYGLLYCGSNANITRIPEYPNKLTHLIVIRSNLQLDKNTFVNYNHLQKLKLKYDNLSGLPLGIFEPLKVLERLDVRYNNIQYLPYGIFRGLKSLQWLFLGSNHLQMLPIEEMAVDLPMLEWLDLSDNQLNLRNVTFPKMQHLLELFLDSNRITYIGGRTFAQLNNLHLLNLNRNLITHIHPQAFWGLKNIRDIRLIANPLKYLSPDTFSPNRYLDALSLGQTQLHIGGALLFRLNVSFLNISGMGSEAIDFTAINMMRNLKYIIFDHFYYCSMTPNVRMCKPNTDGVSSFRHLLSKPVLRYSTWIMALITVSGNFMVLWGRYIYRDENTAVTMVIRNLALADILMGFYLMCIGILDFHYRNEYHRVAMDWMTSWYCVAIGVVAVSSVEVSMFILGFMSLERFLLIANPFRGYHRISMRNMITILMGIWLMGISIAIIPVILWHSSTKFYGTYSGTCFPLHIQEPYPLGWQYSAFVFLGINLFLLIMITLLYTALLLSIYRTRRATPLSVLDYEFAVRFFFIVLTDVLCWAPIVIMKIWVFFNYNISNDVYAWLVVFILPLNSAVNPLLYTFTTPKYRNQVLMKGWRKIAYGRRQLSNGVVNTIATGSTNPDESFGKTIALMISK